MDPTTALIAGGAGNIASSLLQGIFAQKLAREQMAQAQLEKEKEFQRQLYMQQIAQPVQASQNVSGALSQLYNVWGGSKR